MVSPQTIVFYTHLHTNDKEESDLLYSSKYQNVWSKPPFLTIAELPNHDPQCLGTQSSFEDWQSSRKDDSEWYLTL